MRLSAYSKMGISLSRLILLTALLMGSVWAQNPVPPLSFTRTDYRPYDIAYDQRLDRLFVSISELNRIHVIAGSGGPILKTIQVPLPAQITFSPDFKKIYVGSGRYTIGGRPSIVVIDADTLKIIDEIHIPVAHGISQMQLFPWAWGNVPRTMRSTRSGKVLVDFHSWGSTSHVLGRWDPLSGALDSFNDTIRTEAGSLFPSRDGSQVLIAGPWRTVLYDGDSNTITASMNVGVSVAAVNPDGTRIAIAGAEGLTIYDRGFGAIQRLPLSIPGCSSLLYSQDGAYLYCLQSNMLNNWVRILSTSTYQWVGMAPAMLEMGHPRVMDLKVVTNSGLLVGIAGRGVAFVDPSRHVPDLTENGGMFSFPSALEPPQGALGSPTQVTIAGAGWRPGAQAFFGLQPALNTTFLNTNSVTASVPATLKAGSHDVLLTFPDGWALLAPEAYSVGPQIVGLGTNGGPAAGGIPIEIIGYGLKFDPSQVQVRIGAAAANIISLSSYPGFSPFSYPMHRLRVQLPPGLPGQASIEITTPAGSILRPNAFTYVATKTYSYPSAHFNQVVHDRSRDLLYLTDGNNDLVHIFSLEAKIFMDPIAVGEVPVGLSITPDFSKLLVTNHLSATVSVIDLNTRKVLATFPSFPSGQSQDCTSPEHCDYHPLRVVALSNGKALISNKNYALLDAGRVTDLDLTSGAVRVRRGEDNSLFGLFFTTADVNMARTPDGTKVYLTWSSREGSSGGGGVYVYDSVLDRIVHTASFKAGSAATSTSDDGTIYGDVPSLVRAGSWRVFNHIPENELELFEDYIFTDPLNYGSALHPSGSLYYLPRRKSIAIIDSNRGERLFNIALPENAVQRFEPFALDRWGQRLFILTISGLTVVDYSPPFSVANLVPGEGHVAGGTPVLVNGSSFAPGMTATLAGQPVDLVYLDANRAQFLTPPGVNGWAELVVTNGASTYALPLAFKYVEAFPEVRATDPPSFAAGVPVRMTVFGENFAANTQITWNGSELPTTFLTPGAVYADLMWNHVSAAGEAVVGVSTNGTLSNSLVVPITTPRARLKVSPTLLSFRTIPIGSTDPAQQFYILNDGSGDLTITRVSFAGDAVAPTTVRCNSVGMGGVPFTIPAGVGGCYVEVGFSPAGMGLRTGSVIVEDAEGNTATVNISGAGTERLFTLSRAAMHFGSTLVNRASPPQGVVITNVSSASAQLSWGFGMMDRFAGTSDCPFTLPSNASCTVNVNFTPLEPGSSSGTLYVSSFKGFYSIPLSGVGVPDNQVKLSSPFIDFGFVVPGRSSLPQIVRIMNNGTTPVSVSGIAVSGTSGFAANWNDCPATLAAAAQCSVGVTFQPIAAGEANATLLLANVGGASQAVGLTGYGVDFVLRANRPTRTPRNGNVVQAGASLALDFVLDSATTRKEGIAITCTGAPAESACDVKTRMVYTGAGPAKVEVVFRTTARKAARLGSRGTPAGTYVLTVSASTRGAGTSASIPVTVR